VVAVHDVGSIGDEVFVAMEFIEGATLRRWLKAATRSPREILDVFQAAGTGLAAAHRAGIVHRDFKPDNVIIGNDGRVRVLDFGLARSVDVQTPSDDELDPVTPSGSLSVAPRVTLTGTVAGTPAYMAPEQHAGGEVDARADQFAFCVALYEALTGRRPFAGETLAELRAAVEKGELQPPSRRIGMARVRRALRRGLSVRPEARYASMESLLAQLGPRRPWIAAAAAGAVVGAIGATLLASRSPERAAAPCSGAERHLTGVWDAPVKTDVEAAFVASTRAYAGDAFRRVASVLDARAAAWVSMRTDACQATRVRGEQSEPLMDLRMQCLDRRLSEMRALTVVLADRAHPEAVERALDAVLALPAVERCADTEALLAAYPPPEDPAARVAVDGLRARLDAIAALNGAGRYAEAQEAATQVVAEAATVGWAPVRAQAAYWLGALQSRNGDSDASAATLEQAMKLAAEAHDDRLFLDAGTERVYVLGYELARPDDALRLGEVLDPLVTRAGDDPEMRATLLDRVGVVLWAKGSFLEAQDRFELALPLYLKSVGPDHPLVAALHTNLGNVFADQGRNDEAVAQYREELAILERTVGDQHPDVARARANLGTVLQSQGKYDEAQASFERALELWEAAYGKTHMMVAMASNNLGELHNHLADHARALPYCQRAVAIGDELLPADHPIQAYHLLCLGGALLGLQRPAEAIAPLERALAIRDKAGGDGGAEPRFRLAKALWESDADRARAVVLARESRDAYAAAGEPSKEQLAEVTAWLGAHRGR
jgi:tetratricopeptide (TPR) repeat protein